MATVTEHRIFKLCVEKPLRSDLTLLNLQFVKDPDGPADQALQSKALRLYRLVWSALTKYLNKVIHASHKAVEIPGLLILGPLIEKWINYPDPQDKGPETKRTFTKTPLHRRNVIVAMC
jgi:hypothetical protein